MRHRHRVRKRYDRDVTDDIGAPRRRMCANSEPLEQPPCRSLAQQAATAVATAATVDRLGAESAASLLNSWTLRDVCTLSAEPTFGTALWVWGANRDGELGINDFADRPTPELNIWCTGRKMRSAACGRMCTFVDADGVLLACGYTAVMDKDGICVDPQLPMFTPHAATAGRRVLSVRCSGSRVYVVLDTAMLASFETRDTEFRLLHAVRCPLRDGIGSVAFGKRRSFAIRSTGELMEWGPIVPEIMPGSVVDGDDGVCLDTALPFGVARIAAGTRHVAAITRDGTLMTWSEPISKWAYFCGPVAPPPPLHIAVEFPLLHTTTVTEVACGKEHTLALSCACRGDGVARGGVSIFSSFHLLILVHPPSHSDRDCVCVGFQRVRTARHRRHLEPASADTAVRGHPRFQQCAFGALWKDIIGCHPSCVHRPPLPTLGHCVANVALTD